MIPETKLNAVKKALEETFGVSEFEDIRELTSGLSSARVFCIVVKGDPYLLRIITRTDAMGDPTFQFNCMKVAAEAGIAPRIWYLSIEDRISITDFVKAQSFSVKEAKIKLAKRLRELHSLPLFPKLISFQDTIDDFLQRFQEAKILPESMTEELFKKYIRIKDVYPNSDYDLVSCHNDLKPENIIYDGEKVWLVDWEAAFLNDSYADLAVVGNFVIRNDSDEEEYLQTYFGEEVDEYRNARFFLMSQLMHMFYVAVFMPLAAKGKPVDLNMKRSKFRDFHDGIWVGEISLTSDEAKLEYALVHLDQVLKNTGTKRFEEALSIVSNYHSI